MRKIVITLLALGVFAASAAVAGDLLNDSFDRADANLATIVNASPTTANSLPPTMPLYTWGNYSGSTMDVLIRSNEAYFGLTTAGQGVEDDHVVFATQASTVPTYACFNVKIPCFAATAPNAIYFAGFIGNTSITNMVSRTYILPFPGGAAGTWTFGVSHGTTSSTVGVAQWPVALTCDVWYTVVIKYDPVLQTTTLWVNPANEGSQSVSIQNTGITADMINQFFLRQSATAATLPSSPSYAGTLDVSYKVDNLGVGTAFDLACYTTTGPVPAKGSTWGQLKSLYR